MLSWPPEKSIFAHICPRKGADEKVVARLICDLDTLGYRRVLIRTDGEPAFIDLWNKIKQGWWGEISPPLFWSLAKLVPFVVDSGVA